MKSNPAGVKCHGGSGRRAGGGPLSAGHGTRGAGGVICPTHGGGEVTAAARPSARGTWTGGGSPAQRQTPQTDTRAGLGRGWGRDTQTDRPPSGRRRSGCQSESDMPVHKGPDHQTACHTASDAGATFKGQHAAVCRGLLARFLSVAPAECVADLWPPDAPRTPTGGAWHVRPAHEAPCGPGNPSLRSPPPRY